MRRVKIKKGLEPKTMTIEFRCRECGSIWSKEQKIGNREVDGQGLKCPKCKSSAVSLIYPVFDY